MVNRFENPQFEKSKNKESEIPEVKVPSEDEMKKLAEEAEKKRLKLSGEKKKELNKDFKKYHAEKN